MNLDIINYIINYTKENNLIQKFMEELTEEINKNNISNALKREGDLYQVIEVNNDYAYLQNTSNNVTSKETDIDKDLLNNLCEYSVLKYENGKYIYDEEETQRFQDSLIGIKEYKDLEQLFLSNNNMNKFDSSARFEIIEKNDDNTVLQCNDSKIIVPTGLIPYWSKVNEFLVFEDNKFKRIF